MLALSNLIRSKSQASEKKNYCDRRNWEKKPFRSDRLINDRGNRGNSGDWGGYFYLWHKLILVEKYEISQMDRRSDARGKGVAGRGRKMVIYKRDENCPRN